jgi:hypothetical protein
MSVTPSEASSDDRRATLRSLEAAIERAFEAYQLRQMDAGYLVWVYCEDCGEPEVRGKRATRCRECQRKHARELRGRRQRDRRAVAAGLVEYQNTDFFRLMVPVRAPCRHCGTPFLRQRTTARYCSTRCRVAAHRGRR